MDARLDQGTSSRSARLGFCAEFNAELERGRAVPPPRPAGNRSSVDACPCQSGYTVSVSSAARGARGMWACRE